MKQRRTRRQWLALFVQQEQSGLSVSAFCQKHHLSAHYFSKRKRLLKPTSQDRLSSPFVSLQRPATMSSTETIQLRAGSTTLEIPASTSPTWLAELIQALS